MFLDEAAKIVARNGVAGLSLEQISAEADVSKSLIYKYFDSVTDLLKALRRRELEALRELRMAAVEKAETYEEMVRGVTHAYLLHIEERGLIIERLQSEPSIADEHDQANCQRLEAINFLATRTAKYFDLPPEVAKIAVEVSFYMPGAAGNCMLRGEVDRATLEDITVSMIVGAVTQLRNDYFARLRKV